ncbi:MAG: tripartite tricarboxylate transporter substrate binding protein [Proteobacteria bacterium]|nr:tripartite tricarboxylate transporter substrate binding protein [Burkholderiales bacterium]
MKLQPAYRTIAVLMLASLPGAGSAAISGGAASAETAYPTRPIRMLVANAAGSSVDTLGRIFAQALSVEIGQPVVIDNRPGAGGVLGMEIAKNANPDGYTVLSVGNGAMTIAPHTYRKPAYDPLRDYEFVSLYCITPNVLVVNPSLPLKSVKDFIDYSRGKSGQLNMASAGLGSQSHLAGVLFASMAKFESLHVPYKGGGPSVASVVAGEAQWTLTPAPAVAGLIRAGKLRAIAHSLSRHDPLFAELPPIADTVPGFEFSGWIGLLAPRGTPKPIVEKLRTVLLKSVQTPEVKKGFEAQYSQVTTTTPGEFRDRVAREGKLMAVVVQAAGLKLE